MLKPFASEEYRKRTVWGTSGKECCLCGRDTAGSAGALHVPINHEITEFVTDEQTSAMGEAVSYYPIGPECAKRWRKEFAATAVKIDR